MFYQELVDYIKKARASGMSEEEMRKELTTAGWGANDVNEAFILSGGSHVVFPPSLPREEQRDEKPKVLIIESKGETPDSAGPAAYSRGPMERSGSPQGVLPRVSLNLTGQKPAQSVQASPVFSEPVKKSRKGLMIGLIVALLFIGGSAGAYVMFFSTPAVPVQEENITPPPPVDPTAGWKTYRNEEYGFEVKYPEAWIFNGDEEGRVRLSSPERQENRGGEGSDIPPSDIIVAFVANQSEISLKDFAAQYAKSWYSYFSASTSISVDGQPALDFEEREFDKSPTRGVFIQGSTFFVVFSLADRGAENFQIPDSSGVFDQILSTFKFIEATSTKPCVVTGCSSQICADEAVTTTCEFKEEYGCYKTAKCERQTNGACGWTPSAALTSCIKAAQ